MAEEAAMEGIEPPREAVLSGGSILSFMGEEDALSEESDDEVGHGREMPSSTWIGVGRH